MPSYLHPLLSPLKMAWPISHVHTVGVGGPEGISMIGDIASKMPHLATVMQDLNILVLGSKIQNLLMFTYDLAIADSA